MKFSRFPVHRVVLVNTKTDRTFRGVLWKKRGPLLVLRNVSQYVNGGTVPIDGEIIIERSNVDFIQALEQGLDQVHDVDR